MPPKRGGVAHACAMKTLKMCPHKHVRSLLRPASLRKLLCAHDRIASVEMRFCEQKAPHLQRRDATRDGIWMCVSVCLIPCAWISLYCTGNRGWNGSCTGSKSKRTGIREHLAWEARGKTNQGNKREMWHFEVEFELPDKQMKPLKVPFSTKGTEEQNIKGNCILHAQGKGQANKEMRRNKEPSNLEPSGCSKRTRLSRVSTIGRAP
eukprot:833983-Pelagomonas_calceolata.AAC.2